jgi:hypothetical protein
MAGSHPDPTVLKVMGIDWASKESDRGVVILTSAGVDQSLTAEFLACPVDIDINSLCHNYGCSVVAVDVPFGWPRSFVEFLNTYRFRRLSSETTEDLELLKDLVFYRLTERLVRKEVKGANPLSVAANWFAWNAYEWAILCSKQNLGRQFDVLGVPRPAALATIIEVYPAATLKAFRACESPDQLKKYEQSKYTAEELNLLPPKERDLRLEAMKRQQQVDYLCEAFGIDAHGYDSDKDDGQHVLDALISALTGLLYISKGGLVSRTSGIKWEIRSPVTDDEKREALAEGWIFFPKCSQDSVQKKESKRLNKVKVSR